MAENYLRNVQYFVFLQLFVNKAGLQLMCWRYERNLLMCVYIFI